MYDSPFCNPSGVVRFLREVSAHSFAAHQIYYYREVLYLEWGFESGTWTLAYQELSDEATCFKNRHQLRSMETTLFWKWIQKSVVTSYRKHTGKDPVLYYYYGGKECQKILVERDPLYSPLVEELCLILRNEGVERDVLQVLTGIPY